MGCRPVVRSNWATLRHQSPVTSHRSLLEDHQSTSHQSLVEDHQPPVTGHRPPVTSHESPTTGHRSPVNSLQSPVTGHRPLCRYRQLSPWLSLHWFNWARVRPIDVGHWVSSLGLPRELPTRDFLRFHRRQYPPLGLNDRLSPLLLEGDGIDPALSRLRVLLLDLGLEVADGKDDATVPDMVGNVGTGATALTVQWTIVRHPPPITGRGGSANATVGLDRRLLLLR